MFNKNDTQSNDKALRTLCNVCAGRYYNSGDYIIRRASIDQIVKEPCQICQIHMGFDFIIKEKLWS